MSAAAGRVECVLINLKTRQPMKRLDLATAVPGAGLLGCRHSRPGNERAVLLVDIETLDHLGLAAGEIKENITTRGIAINDLKPGAQLQVGETTVLEVTGPCEPCRRMDEVRAGLQAKLKGRRGVTTRVLVGGRILPGDAVALIKPDRELP
jgi:MOSC domain-containing protein YiiM